MVQKAIAEAKKVGEVIVAMSSKDKNYTYIPDCSDLDIPETSMTMFTSARTETIHGVTWKSCPTPRVTAGFRPVFHVPRPSPATCPTTA